MYIPLYGYTLAKLAKGNFYPKSSNCDPSFVDRLDLHTGKMGMGFWDLIILISIRSMTPCKFEFLKIHGNGNISEQKCVEALQCRGWS